MGLHVWIWYRQEPWLVALGARRDDGRRLLVGALLGLGTELLGPAYWIALLLLAALLAFLWRKAVSTQRAFINASSIYLALEGNARRGDGAAEAVARLAAVGCADRRERGARRRELAAARRADSRRFPPSTSRPSPACCWS